MDNKKKTELTEEELAEIEHRGVQNYLTRKLLIALVICPIAIFIFNLDLPFWELMAIFFGIIIALSAILILWAIKAQRKEDAREKESERDA